MGPSVHKIGTKSPSAPREQFASPAGYWIVLRPEIGAPGWIVRILNFASFKYRKLAFDTEAEARYEANKWRI